MNIKFTNINLNIKLKVEFEDFVVDMIVTECDECYLTFDIERISYNDTIHGNTLSISVDVFYDSYESDIKFQFDFDKAVTSAVNAYFAKKEEL